MKRRVVFDAMLVMVVIVTVLNYAEQITVDPKLLTMLVAIALYVVYKTNDAKKPTADVEGFEGSSVAFDKEAFINLNKIINELVKKDQVTIPGNLVVKGKVTFEDDVSLADGKRMNFDKKAYAVFGVGEENRADGSDGFIGYGTHGDGLNIVGIGKNRNIRTWGNVTSVDTAQLHFGLIKCVDLSATSNITAGTDDGNMMRIRQNRIGSKNAGDIEFSTDGWKRNYAFGTGTHNRGFAATEFYCTGTIHNVGNISGGTIATNAITATTVNVTSLKATGNVSGATMNATGKLTCGDLYTQKVDTDVLRGHAWSGSGFKNCIRMERHFTLRNDSGHYLVLGGGWSGANPNAAHGVTADRLEKQNYLWCEGYTGIARVVDSRWVVSWNKNRSPVA